MSITRRRMMKASGAALAALLLPRSVQPGTTLDALAAVGVETKPDPLVTVGFGDDPFYEARKGEVIAGIRGFFENYGITLQVEEMQQASIWNFLDTPFDHTSHFGIYFSSEQDTMDRHLCINEARAWKEAFSLVDRVEQQGFYTPGDVTMTANSHALEIKRIIDEHADEIEHGLSINAGREILRYRWEEGHDPYEQGRGVDDHFYITPRAARHRGAVRKVVERLASLPNESETGEKYIGIADTHNARGFCYNLEGIKEVAEDVEVYVRNNIRFPDDTVQQLCILTACHELGHLFGLAHSHYETEYNEDNPNSPRMFGEDEEDAFPGEIDEVPNVMRHGCTPLRFSQTHPWGEALSPYEVKLVKNFLQQGVTYEEFRRHHFNWGTYIMSDFFRDTVATGSLVL